MDTLRRTTALPAALLLAAALTGCNPPTTQPGPTATSTHATAASDHPTASRGMPSRPPLDRYGPTVWERAAIEWAAQLDTAACLHRRGLAYQPQPVSLPQRRAEDRQLRQRRYGITNTDEAAIYGYLPAPTGLLDRNGGVSASASEGDSQLAKAVTAALIGDPDHPGCLARAQDRIGLTAHGVSLLTTAESLGNAAWRTARHDPRVQRAVVDWASCMTSAGYSLQDPLESGMPPGRARPVVGEIEQALVDIDCKARTGLVGRWQTAEAVAAARIQRTHHDDLAHVRALTQAAVTQACTRLQDDPTYGRACGRRGGQGGQPEPGPVR